MTKKLIIISIIFLIIISLIGCAGSPVSRRGEAHSNRSKLVNLKIGMTKNEVINLMGKPSKSEAYEIQGKNFEFWLYLTEYEWLEYSTRRPEYTPLAFEEGFLKGWGGIITIKPCE